MNKNEPKKRYNKVKMARELAVVRKTGLVNMHDRYTVCDLLFRFGYKTRKINKLLHNNNSSKVVFNDICDVLTGILESDILVISRKGKVLGSGLYCC